MQKTSFPSPNKTDLCKGEITQTSCYLDTLFQKTTLNGNHSYNHNHHSIKKMRVTTVFCIYTNIKHCALKWGRGHQQMQFSRWLLGDFNEYLNLISCQKNIITSAVKTPPGYQPSPKYGKSLLTELHLFFYRKTADS